jgi:hypothetical protein
MTNFKWVFGPMECYVDKDGLTDVVYTVNWRYNATREENGKEYFAGMYGATGVGFPDPATFVPYDQITEEMTIGWMEAALDVPAMQVNLDLQIDLQINPVTVTLPPPFTNTFSGTIGLAEINPNTKLEIK